MISSAYEPGTWVELQFFGCCICAICGSEISALSGKDILVLLGFIDDYCVNNGPKVVAFSREEACDGMIRWWTRNGLVESFLLMKLVFSILSLFFSICSSYAVQNDTCSVWLSLILIVCPLKSILFKAMAISCAITQNQAPPFLHDTSTPITRLWLQLYRLVIGRWWPLVMGLVFMPLSSGSCS